MEVIVETPKEVHLVNLTPHPVVIFFEDGTTHEIPPAGRIARVETVVEKAGNVLVSGKEVPLMKQRYGKVIGLPELQEDVLYIVSNVVAQAVAGKRKDVVIPADFVRDEQGRIIGCKAFAVVEG